MPIPESIAAIKPRPGRVLVCVPQTDFHAHAVAGTSVTLHLPTGKGECADPGAGVAKLVATHPDNAARVFVGCEVYLDPYALDVAWEVEPGFFLVEADALFAVRVTEGLVRPLGKWILGRAVKREVPELISGLLLPQVGEDGESVVGAMRVLDVGSQALPEFVGHAQRRVWDAQPIAYFPAFQNGGDAVRRRRMNGAEYLLLQYADVVALSNEPVAEVKRSATMRANA